MTQQEQVYNHLTAEVLAHQEPVYNGLTAKDYLERNLIMDYLLEQYKATEDPSFLEPLQFTKPKLTRQNHATTEEIAEMRAVLNRYKDYEQQQSLPGHQ